MKSNAKPETWHAVPGFDGYEVSTYGRVRSWWRRGDRGKDEHPHLLNPSPARRTVANPHWVVKVRDDDQNWKVKPVHQLVLLAVCGPRPAGYDALHLNGNLSDNRAMNLVWALPGADHILAIARGRPNLRPQERHPKMTPAFVRRAIAYRNKGGTVTAYAEQHGVPRSSLYDAIKKMESE